MFGNFSRILSLCIRVLQNRKKLNDDILYNESGKHKDFFRQQKAQGGTKQIEVKLPENTNAIEEKGVQCIFLFIYKKRNILPNGIPPQAIPSLINNLFLVISGSLATLFHAALQLYTRIMDAVQQKRKWTF